MGRRHQRPGSQRQERNVHASLFSIFPTSMGPRSTSGRVIVCFTVPDSAAPSGAFPCVASNRTIYQYNAVPSRTAQHTLGFSHIVVEASSSRADLRPGARRKREPPGTLPIEVSVP